MNDLLKTFSGSKEYLASAGWVARDGTFAPKGQLQEPRGVPALRPRQQPGARWHNKTRKGVSFRAKVVRSQRRNACGRGKVRDVTHISAEFPGVDPAYVMDVIVNPEHGHWNPAVRRLVLRHQRRVKADELFPEAFPKQIVRSPTLTKHLDGSKKDVFDVVGQVTEIPIPFFVQKVTGPRHTADFIVERWDAQNERGFTLATSRGTEELAAAAGVEKGQDLCLSAILLAPGTGLKSTDAQGGGAGTRVHLVSHFDARLPSKQLRRIVNIAMRKGVHRMFVAWHKKSIAAQRTGRHRYTA